MDLVENHEPTFVLHQIQFRVSQLCAVRRKFEVEVEGRFGSLRLPCETQRERCFTDLSWTSTATAGNRAKSWMSLALAAR
jgi:hypothetical protein